MKTGNFLAPRTWTNLHKQICGIIVFGTQRYSSMFKLCRNHMNMAVLLHKSALSPKLCSHVVAYLSKDVSRYGRLTHTDFAKSETAWDIITKISAFLQLIKKWILSKFGGYSSKFEPATPNWSFRRFWQEIQILGT